MIRFVLLSSLCLIVAVGCGGPNGENNKDNNSAPKGSAQKEPSAEGRKYMLASEPADARDVLAVREEAKDGDEVTVSGQIGGAEKPFTEGRAQFLLVDSSLKPTVGCDCPWDFCRYSKTDLSDARISVKLVDAEGKTLKTGARELFGVAELSRVVVKGKVKRDEADNVSVVASGIYVKPMPEKR